MGPVPFVCTRFGFALDFASPVICFPLRSIRVVNQAVKARHLPTENSSDAGLEIMPMLAKATKAAAEIAAATMLFVISLPILEAKVISSSPG